MKILKVVGIVVALLVVLIAGVVYYVFDNINSLVKKAVETEGPKITQTDVNLGAVDIDLLDGRAQLNDFVIANPEGFSTPTLFVADELVLQIAPMSLREDVIVLRDIVIDGVNITAEQKGLTTNVQAMLDNIQQASSQEEPAPEQTGETELRFMVEHLEFVNNSLTLKTEKYGEYQVEMPTVEAQNLGDTTTGLTATELGVEILRPYLNQAKRAAQKKLKEAAGEEIEGKLKEKLDEKFGEQGSEAVDKLKGLIGK